MEKKAFIVLLVGIFGLGLLGCAGEKALMKSTPTQIQPLKVTIESVERLNAIAAKPPFQPTDVLVFRVNFKLANPNQVTAKVEDFYFEAKVEDGTRDMTIIQAASMPNYLIPPNGEILWSSTEPFLYGGVRASYLLRGVGGAEGVQGAFKKTEELWLDLGADKKKFYLEGNVTSSLVEFSNLGRIRTQFNLQFEIPKL